MRMFCISYKMRGRPRAITSLFTRSNHRLASQHTGLNIQNFTTISSPLLSTMSGRTSPSWRLFIATAQGEQAQATQLASAGAQPTSQVSNPAPCEALTFGFKVQFLVPGTRTALPEPESHRVDARFRASPVDGDMAREQIARRLHYGLHVVMGHKNVVCEGIPNRDDDSQVVGPVLPNVCHNHNFWRIRVGNDAEPGCDRDNREDCLWKADDSPLRFWDWKEAEVSSPVFITSSTNIKKTLGWLGAMEYHELMVNSFCRVLTREMRLNTSAYNGASQDCDSYGLSITVGLGGNPIPETTIRRFIVVMWLIEEALFKLCSPWRPYDHQSAPMTSRSLLKFFNDESLPIAGPAALQDLIGPRLQQAIHPDKLRRVWYIWEVRMNVLPRVIQSSVRRGCISIPGCDGHAVPNTVQIKQAGSTLRPREIISWTNVCLRLFQLCHFYENESVHRWRLKALLELVVDAMYNDQLSGHNEAAIVLLKQLHLAEDIPVWQEAGRRWGEERCMDHLERDPFVPPQMPRAEGNSAQFRDGHAIP